MAVPRMCPFCSAEVVTTEKIFDEFCSGGETTDCRCEVCGLSWYDDNPEPGEQ